MGLRRPLPDKARPLLTTITVGAGLALVPPLVFARIIDDAIPNGDRPLVTRLGLLTVGLALLNTAGQVVFNVLTVVATSGSCCAWNGA